MPRNSGLKDPPDHFAANVEPTIVIEGPCVTAQRQDLTKIPSFAGKKHQGQSVVAFTKSIDFSLNKLRDISNLGDFRKITHLYLDHNELEETAFTGLKAKRLEFLSITHNNIQDLEAIATALNQSFPNLRFLTMYGNICAPNKVIDLKQYNNYRCYLISILPRLKVIDGEPVTPNELKLVQGRQFDPPLTQTRDQILSTTDKEEMGFSISKSGELCYMPTDNPPKEWEPLYFICGEKRLIGYRSEQHATQSLATPVLIVPLSQYKMVPARKDPTQQFYKISLLPQNPNRQTVYVFSDSETEMYNWMHCISLEGDYFENLSVNNLDFMNMTMEQLTDEMGWCLSQDEFAEAANQVRQYATRQRMEKISSTKISPDELEEGRVIGQGTFGTVYEGRCRGISVAIKKLTKTTQDLSPQELEDFANEIEIMSFIHHPNVISLMGACTAKGNLLIVTELMAGDLEGLVLSQRYFTLAQRLRMAKDAAMGLNWLHGMDPKIIHRDIKPANFLIDDNLRVVISDFGLAATKDKILSDEVAGTLTYIAPEVLREEEVDEKCDIYSFALVMWVLVTRKIEPFPALTNATHWEFKRKICGDSVRPEFPSDERIPNVLKELIETCWSADPDERYPCKKIIDILERLIVNLTVPDFDGQKFWWMHFRDQEKVVWGKFRDHLQSQLQLDFSPDENVLMKALICGTSSISQQESNLQVYMTSFGSMLSYFGPISPPAEFIGRTKSLAHQPWFHGSITIQEAQIKLAPYGPGTYLVHFIPSPEGNENGGWLALVYLTNSRKLKVVNIQRKIRDVGVEGATNEYFEMKIQNQIKRFASLEQAIETKPNLVRPCPGQVSQYLNLEISNPTIAIHLSTPSKSTNNRSPFASNNSRTSYRSTSQLIRSSEAHKISRRSRLKASTGAEDWDQSTSY